jgi:nucleoside-diphosphate-sugar epimerase
LSRILVTGATGFIGRHCLPRLGAAGYEVHALSSQPRRPGEYGAHAWHRFNLLDVAACRHAIEVVRPTHLLHLAWIATPGIFWHSPHNLQWLAGSVELFRAFFEGGGKKTVGLGTCAEYQWTDEGELAEDRSAVHPATIYGQCKAAAGLACSAAAATQAGSAIWVRLFYPYGPGEPAERLIPSVIRGLLERKPVQCSEGRQARDFIFVEDVADALVALLGSTLSGVYNLGMGTATPIRDVVNLIASTLGRPELVTFGARASGPNEPMRIVADMSRLNADLSWRPKVAVREGIERTIKDYRAINH